MAKSSFIIGSDKSVMGGLLLSKEAASDFPQVGSNVNGKVIYVGKNEVYVDINGLTTGLIRGRELNDESGDYINLHPGDEIEATLVELENEYGLMELSLRHAGHQKAWTQLTDLLDQGSTVIATAIDANKGGLMVKVGGVMGFLPVSQLTSQNYPRVEGGDKNRILELLKGMIGKSFETKVIDVDEATDKLIVSEKAAWEEKQQADISEYKADDVVEGRVSGIVDFGVFVEFGKGLEGLVHISEMAWHRVDKPGDMFKVGEPVQAKIIEIDGAKISLSIKRTKQDPWKKAAESFTVGSKVKGKVLKVNPFGLFVELSPEIHGLAHISELSNKKIKDINQIAKAGDIMDFFVISIEPEMHRLGLSLKEKKADTNSDQTENNEDDKNNIKVEKKSDEKTDNKNQDKKDVTSDSKSETV